MKKGSISLSINMIVYIVVGLVLLGAILGLGQTIIDRGTQSVLDISEITRQQILDELSTGNKPLSFPQNNIEVKLNERKLIAIGVKNNFAGDRLFQLRISGVTQDGQLVVAENRKELEFDVDGQPGNEKVGEFQYSVVLAQQLAAGEPLVIPVFYEARGTQKDTFSFLLEVIEADPDDTTQSSIYASKSFFITVV